MCPQWRGSGPREFQSASRTGQTQVLQAASNGGLAVRAREEVQDADGRLAVAGRDLLRGEPGLLHRQHRPVGVLAGVGQELAIDLGGVLAESRGRLSCGGSAAGCGWESCGLARGTAQSHAAQGLAQSVPLVVDVRQRGRKAVRCCGRAREVRSSSALGALQCRPEHAPAHVRWFCCSRGAPRNGLWLSKRYSTLDLRGVPRWPKRSPLWWTGSCSRLEYCAWWSARFRNRNGR